MTILRTYNVFEGNSVLVRITGADIESYSGSAQTVDGTALVLPGLPDRPDYVAFSDSSSGTRPYTATIQTLDDDIYEGATPEFFKLTGSATTRYFNDSGVLVSEFNTGVFTFRINDEADRPNLSIAPVTVTETDVAKDVAFTVTADHAASFDYEVTVTIPGGSDDFATITKTVVMAAYSTSVDVTFSLVGDDVMEVNPADINDRSEKLQIEASSAYDTASEQITIINDDGPTITVTGADNVILDEGGPAAAMTFTLSEAVPYDISIFATVREGDEEQFSLVKSGFVIPAGQTTPLTVDVLAAAKDGVRFETVQLSNIQFIAVAAGSEEDVKFSGSGENFSQVYDVKIRGELLVVLESPTARASEVTSKMHTYIEIFNDGLNKGLFGIGTIEAYGEALKEGGKVLKKAFAGLNIAVVELELANDLAAANNSQDPELQRAIAYRKANIALLEMVAELVVAEAATLAGASALAGFLVFLGAAPAVAAGLSVVAIGVAAVVTYDALISPLVKRYINEKLEAVEPIPPAMVPQTSVPGVDGTNTYAGTDANERFAVDSTGDLVVETANGGYDTVVASVSYRLAANVESMILTSSARNGLGNGKGNYMEGSTGNNTLRGAAGNDLMRGMAGRDLLDGGTGNDALLGGAGDDTLGGGSGDDSLAGGAGTNSIDGGAGIDTAAYGDASGPVNVDLAAGTGSGAGFSDGLAGIENVSGSASGDVIAGDAADNALSGMEGNDTLTGLAGNDALSGGDGVDVLVGGAGADAQSGGNGIDWASYANADARVVVSLGGGMQAEGEAIGDTFEGIERLWGSRFSDVLRGNNDVNLLKGAAGNDILQGMGGNDSFFGEAGEDTCAGGLGNDTFNFAAVSQGGDRITDFANTPAGNDTLRFVGSAFGGLAVGALDPSRFVANIAGEADTADQRFVYDSDNGRVYFDSNGNAVGGKTLMVTLLNKPVLSVADFEIA